MLLCQLQAVIMRTTSRLEHQYRTTGGMRYSILELVLIGIRLMTGHWNSRHDVALCTSKSKAKTYEKSRVFSCLHCQIHDNNCILKRYNNKSIHFWQACCWCIHNLTCPVHADSDISANVSSCPLVPCFPSLFSFSSSSFSLLPPNSKLWRTTWPTWWRGTVNWRTKWQSSFRSVNRLRYAIYQTFVSLVVYWRNGSSSHE